MFLKTVKDAGIWIKMTLILSGVLLVILVSISTTMVIVLVSPIGTTLLKHLAGAFRYPISTFLH